MRSILVLACLMLLPAVQAHGALEINEFDIYAISDFEGHEDSFAWEGWEIWDVYAGDGYLADLDSDAVYFKVNFAGDGSLRPTGGEEWEVRFSYQVGDETYERHIVDDGTDVKTDFEMLEWQIADGNVFQIHAWAPVPAWEGQEISELVVTSFVDGEPRDSAPGGIYDPVTGTEVPVEAPSTFIFPPLGEGRIVETVPLTGPAKWLNVTIAESDGAFKLKVTNPLRSQGQHVMFQVNATDWNLSGVPNAASLDGGASTESTLRFTPSTGVVRPAQIDIMTDIGGRHTYFASMSDDGVQLTSVPHEPYTMPAPDEEAQGLPLVGTVFVLGLLMRRRGW